MPLPPPPLPLSPNEFYRKLDEFRAENGREPTFAEMRAFDARWVKWKRDADLTLRVQAWTLMLGVVGLLVIGIFLLVQSTP